MRMFPNTAKRENLYIQPDRHTKKTQFNERRSYIHHCIVSPLFIYVWTTFEHQVRDTDKKFNVLIVLAGLKHISGTGRATNNSVGAVTGSSKIPQNTTFTVNGVEHERRKNILKKL